MVYEAASTAKMMMMSCKSASGNNNLMISAAAYSALGSNKGTVGVYPEQADEPENYSKEDMENEY